MAKIRRQDDCRRPLGPTNIPRAPSQIVSVSETPFESVWESIVPNYDWGSGTVWVGDNKNGWHGGAKMLRWIRNIDDAKIAFDFFTDICDSIRIMPFMDGIPCSIHGWVFADKTIGLRPVRCSSSTRWEFTIGLCGAATWKPTETHRKEMVESVEKVGDYLRENVGYRGSFTMDGVMTKQGFLPTELNPRFGGALNHMSSSLPNLPLYLLHIFTVGDSTINVDPESFRGLIVDAAEQNPIIRGCICLRDYME